MVPLQRSDSLESTQSEREFRKKYQAITHRMVHRKSSAVMYSRILERTFGKTLLLLSNYILNPIKYTNYKLNAPEINIFYTNSTSIESYISSARCHHLYVH